MASFGSGYAGPVKEPFSLSNADRGNISNGSQKFRTASVSRSTSSTASTPVQRGSEHPLPSPASKATPTAAAATSTPQAMSFSKTSGTTKDDAGLAGSIPSSVPKTGRRRESISTQMRKLVTESPVAAAGGGLNFQRSMGQTIAPISSLSKPEKTAFSASMGAMGDVVSSSQRTPSSSSTATHGKPERAGHLHFGQECNLGARRASVSSVATDADDDKGSIAGGEGRGQTIHRCESCSKAYRHPSCLIKHRWEHTVYWKEASKFLLSKHQQVQLLEAAAILVGMDTESRSLPEEKALWPAAVSPASSGLLGSDKINFDLLMAMKSNARKSPSAGLDRGKDHGRHRRDGSAGTPFSTSSTTLRSPSASRSTYATSLPAHASAFSPINTLSSNRYTRNADIASLRLDESAERSMREESVEVSDNNHDFDDYDEQDDNMTGSTSISAGSPSRDPDEREQRSERYGIGAGGDVMAEMDMEMEGSA